MPATNDKSRYKPDEIHVVVSHCILVSAHAASMTCLYKIRTHLGMMPFELHDVAGLNPMKYVMLSSNLRSDAAGHYLPFHEALFSGFTAAELDITYLGAREKLAHETWYLPVLSPGLNKPVPWTPYSSFSKKLSAVTKNCDFTLIIFEGNLATTFLVTQYLMRHRKGIAIVNQFRGDVLSKRLNSNYTRFLYKMIFRNLIRLTGNRLVLSSDNANFQNFLERKLNYPILKFKMFSPLIRTDSEKALGTKILILVRGSEATALVLQALLRRAENIEYVIHGITKNQLAGAEYLEGIEFLKTNLDASEYRKSYLDFNFIVIMYSPADFANVSSGRIYDAFCMGIPVYAPRGTSMATELEEEFIFNFDSEEELVKVLNKPTSFTRPIKRHENFAVSHSVSELVRISNIAHLKRASAGYSKPHFIQKFLMRLVWIAYGVFSFILLRGFLKPQILLDSLKMRMKGVILGKR